jgi:hypothetical protein
MVCRHFAKREGGKTLNQDLTIFAWAPVSKPLPFFRKSSCFLYLYLFFMYSCGRMIIVFAATLR